MSSLYTIKTNRPIYPDNFKLSKSQQKFRKFHHSTTVCKLILNNYEKIRNELN